jgi:hypothetical protein
MDDRFAKPPVKSTGSIDTAQALSRSICQENPQQNID